MAEKGVDIPDWYDPDNPLSYKPVPEDPFLLDFTGCETLEDVHEVLKNGLGLPDYYGRNWDALWDVADDIRDYPVAIELRGVHTLAREWIPRREVELMLEVFADIHKSSPHIEIRVVS